MLLPGSREATVTAWHARADALIDPLCSGCSGRVSEVSRSVIGWTLIGALGVTVQEKISACTAPATDLSEADAQQISCAPTTCACDPSLRGLRAARSIANYHVHTDAGPAFLRINQGKTEADAVFESELIWHLGSHGLATPQLWRTRTSAPYVMWRRAA